MPLPSVLPDLLVLRLRGTSRFDNIRSFPDLLAFRSENVPLPVDPRRLFLSVWLGLRVYRDPPLFSPNMFPFQHCDLLSLCVHIALQSRGTLLQKNVGKGVVKGERETHQEHEVEEGKYHLWHGK